MGKASLQYWFDATPASNSHATALLNRVVNLDKEAVEHLNPNQTPVLTMDQPLPAIAKEIQWLRPDSFSNNKYVIIPLCSMHLTFCP